MIGISIQNESKQINVLKHFITVSIKCVNVTECIGNFKWLKKGSRMVKNIILLIFIFGLTLFLFWKY